MCLFMKIVCVESARILTLCSAQANFRFYSALYCVLPLQEVALHQSLSLSFAILFHATPCCSSSHLSNDVLVVRLILPSVCQFVLLTVHLLSFIRAMCPGHFYFALVTYWTMSVTLVLCLMVVLRILPFCLTLSILLSFYSMLACF